MRKKLLAAGIVRDFEFDSHYEFDQFINSLQRKWYEFEILDSFTRTDGSVVARILTQYNNVPLIVLYEDC